jgi:hypothetical protein
VPNGEQGDIEASTMHGQMILYEPCGVGREGRIAGEETRRFISIYKIHIGRTAPAVDSVSISLVRRCGSPDSHAVQLGSLAWRHSNRVPVSLLPEPSRNGRRSEQGNVVGQRVQRIEREMISVSVRKQYGIELWQGIECNAWGTHAREKFAECRIKIGVGEEALPPDLN